MAVNKETAQPSPSGGVAQMRRRTAPGCGALYLALVSAIFITLTAACTPASKQPATMAAQSQPFAITLDSGVILRGEEGRVAVPENRADAGSRRIAIGFRRFSAVSAASPIPIFLLAGGPGGSYAERLDEGGARQAHTARLIELLRRTGDVVLVDLRGVYLSTPNTLCNGVTDKSRPVSTRQTFLATYREIGISCRRKLIGEGFDISAYTPVSAAADVIGVAAALGYDKINLYGRSFGSHWALVIAKYHPERVGRLLLEGVESFDHTYDDATAVRAAVARIAKAAAPVWDGAFGHTTPLDALSALAGAAQSATGAFGLTPFEIASAVTQGSDYWLSARAGMAAWPAAAAALMRGEVEPIKLRRETIAAGMGLGWDAAAIGMFDCASGISAARRARLQAAGTAAVIDDLMFYDAYCQGWAIAPLAQAFRDDITIDAPALVFAGSYDIATPIENALQLIEHLPNGHMTTVIGGSHDAMSEALDGDQGLAQAIVGWFRGGGAPAAEIVLAPLVFKPLQQTELESAI